MSNLLDIDALTASITAFNSFADLTNAEGGYHPTLLARYGQEYVDLADAYDAHMESVDDPRRAYRGADGEIILSVRLSRICPHGKVSNECCGYAEWLRVIHEINRMYTQDGLGYAFEAPTSSYEQSGARWFEEYPEYRVILSMTVPAGANYVAAKTPRAAEYLRLAAFTVTGRPID